VTARRLLTRARVGVLTLALTAAAGGASHATAAPAPTSPPDRHCTVSLNGGAVECFGSFADAVATASDGRVKDAPASARAAAKDDGFRASLAGEVIQGTFFEHSNYGGASLTVYGAAPCKKDGWVEYQLDLDDWWKDRITSVQPWANCWLWLYPEPNLGGDRDGPFKENTPDIGSFMNDRTESIGFS
jgi:hypothetical protein